MTLVAYATDSGTLQRWPDTWVLSLDSSPVSDPDDSDPFAIRLEVTQDWVPESLVWGTNGQPSTLNLRRILGQGNNKTEDYYPERIQLIPGTTVVLERRDADGGTEEWFRGLVGQSHLMIQPDDHHLNAIAYGPELLLNAIAVTGQWAKTTATDDDELAGSLLSGSRIRENIWQTYLPCIFNENGLPNCSRASDNSGNYLGWKLDTDNTTYLTGDANPCRVFEASNRVVTEPGETTATMKAVHWTAYRAIRSLLEWYDHYQVISWDTGPWAELETDLDSKPLPEVNVQGMGLGDALTEILRAVGYGWCLSPWSVLDEIDAQPRYRLYVYSLTTPKTNKSPLMAPLSSHATDADAVRAMVERFEYLKDAHNVRNQVIVIGDQARIQTALDFDTTGSELSPYWNTTTHNLDSWDSANEITREAIEDAGLDPADFSKLYDEGGSAYPGNDEVFRGFGWGEDGHMGKDMIPDLITVADAAGNAMRRPRPMGPCVEYDRTDAQMRHHPACVYMALSRNGSVIAASWRPVNARIWQDHCGFTLQRGVLLDWAPWADTDLSETEVYAGGDTYADIHYLTALHNTIKYQAASHSRLCIVFRLHGTLETDATVTATGDGTPFITWPTTATKVIDARRRFRKRSVSISGRWGVTTSDARDDAADAQLYANNLIDAVAAPVGHGSMMLRHVTKAWVPGTGIFETAGRRILLTTDVSQQRCAIVSGVRWNFSEGANKTELLLDTQLLGLIQ